MQGWRCLFILEVHLVSVSESERSQAGSHPSDPPLPVRGEFLTEACPALSEADWLYLLFEFSGCFGCVLRCCLRDYPSSEFVFQTSSIGESRAASFYYMCEGIWLRSPVSVSLHLFAPELAFFFFFVTRTRRVNNTFLVVGNKVGTAFFWRRCVRCLAGAPPWGKPIPCSSLWSHVGAVRSRQVQAWGTVRVVRSGSEVLLGPVLGLAAKVLRLAVEAWWNGDWTRRSLPARFQHACQNPPALVFS